MKIAIQGEPGSFHAVAAKRLYGEDIELICCDSFKQVFKLLANEEADEAVVAIENSLYGSINDVYDLLLSNDTWIHGEVYELINLFLFGTQESSTGSITDVYSHPAALGEAEDYLDKTLPDARRHEHSDTAAAAEMVASADDQTKAAIASRHAGEELGLKVLAEHIETHEHNYTRFIALSREQKSANSANKTSIIFRTVDKPGALYNALGVFAKYEINLSKLESRPIIGEAWQYMYYIDFKAGTGEQRTIKALEELAQYASNIRILGSYKAGQTVEA